MQPNLLLVLLNLLIRLVSQVQARMSSAEWSARCKHEYRSTRAKQTLKMFVACKNESRPLPSKFYCFWKTQTRTQFFNRRLFSLCVFVLNLGCIPRSIREFSFNVSLTVSSIFGLFAFLQSFLPQFLFGCCWTCAHELVTRQLCCVTSWGTAEV